MPEDAVVALAGRIGSGKSSIADALAKRLGCGKASFGGYVRTVAADRGLEPTRVTLQQVGEELITQDPYAFVKAVLARYGYRQGYSFVIEGIRHVSAISALRELARPQIVLLVYLDTAEDQRHERVIRRDGINETDLQVVESHSTESQVKTLVARMADLVVDANSDPTKVVDVILKALSEKGSGVWGLG